MTETIKTGIIAVRRKLHEVSGKALTAIKIEEEHSIMRTFKILINICICLFFVFSFFRCNVQPSSNCSETKIQLLFEDLLKKKEYFPAREMIPYNPSGVVKTDTTHYLDCVGYFCYLCSSTLRIPNKDLYLHWNNSSVSNYPDSVKLIERTDTTKINRVAYIIGVNLLEANEDTTKLKVALEYSIGGIANSPSFLYRGYFSYSFSKDSCKWTALELPGTPDY
jgi:hypothetical protein